ncbi:MAG: PAS domain-containing protein [Planctomycetaceae bacterium]|nr:PAS domain-containing protein [Planctomycetales bacterium]MCB9924444.1 PAS domain-containing protein [Planctomycetaceae bacterium]
MKESLSDNRGRVRDGVDLDTDSGEQAIAGAFHIVGVGASAGGLEALETLFDHVPEKSGMAFVVVQHLSPDFRSMMDELLSRHTRMAIHRVEDGMRVEPDSVYLIPPKKEMIIQDGQLLLSDKDPKLGLSLPIDTFLRSLAQDAGDRAIAVILSGTGSDGSRGVKAIHDAGGLVIVQSEESARFDGMPKAALETGIVDLIVPPDQMAGAISRFATIGIAGVKAQESEISAPSLPDAMNAIFQQLRLEYGIDFSWYKTSTVSRRIERRLQMLRVHDLDEYVERLRTDARELNQLYKDLLIGVTKFFRDPQAFDVIGDEVLPSLLNRIPDGGEARLWIAGCGTGEEAYSLAILVQEQLERLRRPIEVKIFATDVHRASLDFARAAVYARDALSELDPQRIERYFVKSGHNYQVSADLRKLIVFAPHNVIKDAPFTKIDLISCRNLLIYLEPLAQQKVLSLFHFAMNTGGTLFLGSSESPADLSDEFEPVDRHWKIYRKRRDVRLRTNLPLASLPDLRGLRADNARRLRPPQFDVDQQVLAAYAALVDEHGPPSFLVDDRHQLVYSFPGASTFLQPRDGEPSSNILDLVAPELRVAIAGAMQRSTRQHRTVTFTGVRIETGIAAARQVRLVVKPLNEKDNDRSFFLISLFLVEPESSESASSNREPVDMNEVSRERVDLLENDLRHTRENLQATIEELEASNEELQATNEELVASNEELQSTNEELHSVNEELYTVNAEHQKKIDELIELTDDMDNLFHATDIGTIFLDERLCIRKFTPNAARNFQILPQDTGRRIDSFTHNLLYPELFHDIRQVASGDTPGVQRDVVDSGGTWYFVRILPYRSQKDAGGVLMSLIDISALKATQHELHAAYDALNSSLNGTVIANFDWEIQYSNPAFSRMFGLAEPVTLKGRRLSQLFLAENVRRMTEICSNLDEDHSEPLELSIQRPDGSMLGVDIRSCVVSDGNGKARGRMVSFIDITRRKKAEEQRESYATELELANETLRHAEQEARDAVENRDCFLATLSHELRNPLAGLLNAQRVLEHDVATTEDLKNASQAIKRQAEHMSLLLNDLLDVARVTQGKIDFQKSVFDIRELVPDAVLAVKSLVQDKQQQLYVDQPDRELLIEGDSARLLQVLENLLTNATKYTPREGRIQLSLSREDNDCRISVRDSGRGIKPELLANIFDMFVQADETLDRREGGMGVGLTLVRSLVEMHGGTVWARSEGEQQGSEFVVRLPISYKRQDSAAEGSITPPDSENDQKPGNNASAGRTAPVRVLLVEDNADAREMLRTLLELDGYQVQVAENGKVGLEMLLQSRPDVALVDIGLPEVDGYEVARRVRKSLDNGDVYLVALTGYGQHKDRAAVFAAGFDEHLVKPVDLRALARILSRPRQPK